MHEKETNLSSPLTVLRGVGPALAEKLKRLHLRRVEDLLFLLPLRYEDRTKLCKIGALMPGMRGIVSGEVLLAETVYRGRRNLLVRIDDGSGQMTLRFFYFSRQQKSAFQAGALVSAFGDVRAGPVGIEMVHPEYRVLRPQQSVVVSNTLTPIYPMTEGVQQGRLRNLAGQALAMMKKAPPDELLPQSVRDKYRMPSLVEALILLHEPPPGTNLAEIDAGKHPCQLRLCFEELLAHYMSLRNLRDLARKESAVALGGGGDAVARFIGGLPYRLTAAQQRVIAEITSDLESPHPMMRLIQGDVGSGKTVVAAFAMQLAVRSGFQTALLAPTEILAEQHVASLTQLLEPTGITPRLLTGSCTAA